jgi:hypothetical protein
MAGYFGSCKRCGANATGHYMGGTDGYCDACSREVEDFRIKSERSKALATAKKLKSEGLTPSDLDILGIPIEIIKEVWS